MADKFVVLRSIETGDVFWSTAGDRNPERMADGRIAYEVIAYTDDDAEAQRIWAKHSPFGGLAR